MTLYFPYLRGKQFELLALKELSPLLGEQQKVLPIIEPVRVPDGSGLDRCLSAVAASGLEFVLIMNPTVGELRGQPVAAELVDYVRARDPERRWNLGLIFQEATDVPGVLGSYSTICDGRPLTVVHKGLARDLDALGRAGGPPRRFDVIDDSLRQRHFRGLLTRTDGVTMHDGFPSEDRNADYLGRNESQFSDDHLFYQEDGWFGFSDYLTVGEGYVEGGFTPRAVAIHWTYEPEPGSAIMIRHFTSESNADTSNVGGKFLEAAEKLVSFLDERDIHTIAAEVFRAHLANSTYPGLGIVKKLSMQNHLQLVSEILCRP